MANSHIVKKESDMSRKDYEAIAASLYLYARPHMSHDQYLALVYSFAEYFASQSNVFQRALFEVACLHGTSVKQPHSVKIRA